MTLLDAAVLAVLALIGAGGYHQGLIRGITRAAALLATGALAALLTTSATIQGTIQQVLVRTLAIFGGVLLVVATLTWLINWAIPRSFHATLINKILGIVPALLVGVIVLALALGFFHRIAIDQAMQDYLAHGLITGPLIQPFGWLERTLAGVQ